MDQKSWWKDRQIVSIKYLHTKSKREKKTQFGHGAWSMEYGDNEGMITNHIQREEL